MHSIVVERTDPTIDRICRTIGYNGRKVTLKMVEGVTLQGTYWSGGSRSTYTAMNLATFEVKPAPAYNPPQFGGPTEPPTVPLTDGLCVIEHSIFCGRDMGLTIFIHPTNAAPMLPAGDLLTATEAGILSAFRSLKSGPYRNEALSRYSPEDIAQCVSKGFLKQSSNGARQITTKGKNALSGHRRPSGGTY